MSLKFLVNSFSTHAKSEGDTHTQTEVYSVNSTVEPLLSDLLISEYFIFMNSFLFKQVCVNRYFSIKILLYFKKPSVSKVNINLSTCSDNRGCTVHTPDGQTVNNSFTM